MAAETFASHWVQNMARGFVQAFQDGLLFLRLYPGDYLAE